MNKFLRNCLFFFFLIQLLVASTGFCSTSSEKLSDNIKVLEVYQLTHLEEKNESVIGDLVWHPNGREITFSYTPEYGSGSDRSGFLSIYHVDLKGSCNEILPGFYAGDGGSYYESPLYGGGLSWSPDGKWLCAQGWFKREGLPQHGETPSVYLINYDSKKYRNVFDKKPSSSPVWSNDGKRLVFIYDDKGLFIRVINLHNEQDEVIKLKEEGKIFSSGVSGWSSNGKGVYYYVERLINLESPEEYKKDLMAWPPNFSKQIETHFIELKYIELKSLTSHFIARFPQSYVSSSISPSGDGFLFASYSLYLITKNGKVKRLQFLSDAPISASWSPRGKYIAFDIKKDLEQHSIRGRSLKDLLLKRWIFIVSSNPSSAYPRNLYQEEPFRGELVTKDFTEILNYGEKPKWSPDGRRIAFIRDGQIWIAEVEIK